MKEPEHTSTADTVDLAATRRLFPTAVGEDTWGLSGGEALLRSYHAALNRPVTPCPSWTPEGEVHWNARYRIQRKLGQGAQGVVYLAERKGVDGYFTKVALKFFPRHPKTREDEYLLEMQRIALQAQRVSEIQHDHLVSIRDFVSLCETRVMVLEWIDGLDLSQMLELDRLEELRRRVSRDSWERLNDVVVTRGDDHCRLKPGIAVDIVRGCLAGLAALHHRGIVHCDMKPSNIMVKRRGTKKIIDIDSSCIPSEDSVHVRGTPYYMAPEHLRGEPVRYSSDIASLGYILVEMLTGRMLFAGCTRIEDLLKAKMSLPGEIWKILPPEVSRDSHLWGLIHKMIALQPENRFPDADAADLDQMGAGSFHRHLVKTNLSTEYDRELAWWMGLLGEDLGSFGGADGALTERAAGGAAR